MVHSLTDYVVKATTLVAQMTLEEKALLLSGDGWWRTHRVDGLQIPSICMTDGPHGLRKVEGEGLGLSTSVPATCFPTASALASTWMHGAGAAGKSVRHSPKKPRPATCRSCWAPAST